MEKLDGRRTRSGRSSVGQIEQGAVQLVAAEPTALGGPPAAAFVLDEPVGVNLLEQQIRRDSGAATGFRCNSEQFRTTFRCTRFFRETGDGGRAEEEGDRFRCSI